MKMLVALVGTKFRGPEAVALLASLPNGAPIYLVREPTNAHDPRCVHVWANGVHIGFIKKEQNAKISARIDARLAAFPPPVLVNTSGTYVPGWPAKLAIDGGKQPMVEIDE